MKWLPTDILLTTMNGEPRYEKPPLPTWLSAFSSILFGTRSLLHWDCLKFSWFMLLGIYTYLFSNKLLNNSVHSFYNGMIAITFFLYHRDNHRSSLGYFYSCFHVYGIYYLFRLFENENHRWDFSILSGIFIGFSILSKVLFLFMHFFYLLVTYGITYRYKLKNKLHLFVIIIVVLIGCWWYCYVYFQDSQTFHLFQKETGNWADYNVKPFYYYWSFFCPKWFMDDSCVYKSIISILSEEKLSNLKVYKLTLLWTLFVVVFFIFHSRKKLVI